MMPGRGVIVHGSDRKKNVESARIMAISFMADGRHESHKLIERHVLSNTYPNFLAIRSNDAEISIDFTRQAIDFLQKKPVLSGGMVVVIEDAEEMSKNAANSLLKILEEMPNDSLVIFVTARLLSIIPTIRSRCEKVRCPSRLRRASDFDSPLEYICSSFQEIHADVLKSLVSTIESRHWNLDILNLKKHLNNIETFLKIIIAYHSYYCNVRCSILDSRKILTLQSLLSLSRDTYPDEQSIICAANAISKTETTDILQ
jgi:hypothetical protein